MLCSRCRFKVKDSELALSKFGLESNDCSKKLAIILVLEKLIYLPSRYVLYTSEKTLFLSLESGQIKIFKRLETSSSCHKTSPEACVVTAQLWCEISKLASAEAGRSPKQIFPEGKYRIARQKIIKN